MHINTDILVSSAWYKAIGAEHSERINLTSNGLKDEQVILQFFLGNQYELFKTTFFSIANLSMYIFFKSEDCKTD